MQASGTLLLSPTVTTTELTGKDDNFLRVIDDTRSYATKSAGYQRRKLGHRSVAILFDEAPARSSGRAIRASRAPGGSE